ncbi:hypothetical protein H0H92_006480 [Tricholoma furcatifolium]|nr:hypothetical protein H0H92_006480 [Tricholoma furcatifolium]
MGKSPVSIAACASLGLHVVHIPNPHVTHHITTNYTAQPVIASSLLSASQFVKIEWLNEVIRLGILPNTSQESLERNFELPPLSKYRPAYSPSLPTSQKEFRVWEPNEERLMMFSSYRFLWVDEKSRLGDYKEVIERGGGSFETFDSAAGKSKFHRALTRGQAKEGKTQVVVGKAKSLTAAIGKEAWRELVDEAKSFGLHIVEPDLLVQVVIEVDTSLFHTPPSPDMDNDSELPQSNSLPDFIPNTHAEEPSVPPSESTKEPAQESAPRKRLIRRVTSRQASQEPASVPKAKTPEPEQESEPEVAPPPRKALTRRVKAGGMPIVVGFDDPSMILDSVPDLSAPTSVTLSSPPPQPTQEKPPSTQAPRSSRLKRRVGVTNSDAGASQVVGFTLEEPTEEPPLKKFKALFEASGQEYAQSGTLQSGASDGDPLDDASQSIPVSYSQTQNDESQTQGGRAQHRRTGSSNLGPLREEEEESQQSSVPIRGTKRSLNAIDEDIEMGDGDERDGSTGSRLPKKRAVENVNAVEKVNGATRPPVSNTRAGSKPPSAAGPSDKTPTKRKAGALPGKPDRDDKFLKAIASTKKGKRTEDDFDRDFNKLKITKPTLEREDPEEQWGIVADFGDDIDVRGNFMVVVEMPVYNRGRRGQVSESASDWEGRPNFKKFNKKKAEGRRAKIELVTNAHGLDDDLDANLQDDGFGPTEPKAKPKSEIQSPRSQAAIVIDDDEDFAPTRKGRSKPSSRASSAAPPKRAPVRSKAPIKQQQLFLDDEDADDDIQTFDGDDAARDSDEEQTLRSTAPRGTQRRPARAASRKPVSTALLIGEDSDDGAVFQGFAGKRRR